MDEARIDLKQVGFAAYPETPADWRSVEHVVSREPAKLACGTPMDVITFVHPFGTESKVYAPPRGEELWSPFDELDIVVRHGSDSEEHKQFLEMR